MNKWFLRGNSRRFYRIDMPVHAYIAPTSPIKDLEIYATGTDYFPPTTLTLIQKQLSETRYWLDKIQDQKELLELLFNEIIACIEFLGKGTEKISKGINPRNSPDYWLSIKQIKQGFKTIHALQKSAPKTYTYFKLIEAKYISFLNAFANSIENSTPQKFAASSDILYAFKIDEILENFSNPKFDKIPLIQAIIHLASFMNIYLNAFRQINDDNLTRLLPNQWPKINANLSASGIAVLFTKLFQLYEKVDVFLYFPENKKVLKFDGSVVKILSINEKHKEKISINFEFPDGKNQDFLTYKIQEFELNLCLDVKF